MAPGDGEPPGTAAATFTCRQRRDHGFGQQKQPLCSRLGLPNGQPIMGVGHSYREKCRLVLAGQRRYARSHRAIPRIPYGSDPLQRKNGRSALEDAKNPGNVGRRNKQVRCR